MSNILSPVKHASDYKYTVTVCNNGKSVCQYCHIKITPKDLMIMKRGQFLKNGDIDAPIFMGYHCDCFFLSFNIKNVSELHGYSLLSKYHRQYIYRKIHKKMNRSSTNHPESSKELPHELRVGYNVPLSASYSHFCEECAMVVNGTDLKITGALEGSEELVIYHPRCFSMTFGSIPISLQGFDKLTYLDCSRLASMLTIIGFNNSRSGRSNPSGSSIDSMMIIGKSTESFNWPRPHPTSSSQRPSIYFDDEYTEQPNSYNHTRADYQRSSNYKLCKNSESEYAEHASHSTTLPIPPRKRKISTSFRPNIDSTRNKQASFESTKPKKVELKKTMIRSEITKILYKYNHDFITSKIVRTMLMESFGCDLTPHKKYIDDTIMELLEIIDNDPINLKSIPGRIFVDEEDDTSPNDPTTSNALPPMMLAMDDADISPFCIMSNTADEMAVSNVDNTIRTPSSKHAWGDKSNSPTETGTNQTEDNIDNTIVSSLPKLSEKPIELFHCCLCCFRIQTLEELVSLYHHIQNQHLSNKNCVVCDISFKDVYGLMLHIAEFHRTTNAFTCKNCEMVFEYHSDLKKHVEMCILDRFSDISDDEDAPPSNKRLKLNNVPTGFPGLVSTLQNTQNTLNKINEFISESGGFESDDSS